MNCLPIRDDHEVLFAEALSQTLFCGMEISSAISVAADTSRSSRFRYGLHEMAGYCRQGNSLLRSLAKTKMRTTKQFQAAVDVGESRGCLANELSAFARSRDPQSAIRLAMSVGRSDDVTRFMNALARLLIDHRLTIDMLADAARVAAGAGSHFEFVVAKIIEDMKDGRSISEAMQRQSDAFDSFLRSLIKASPGRDVLRKTLARACGEIISDERNQLSIERVGNTVHKER